MSMTYEAWRISFQSSEQAARSAYDQLAAARARIDAVGEAALSRQAKFQRREAELLADNARLREALRTWVKCCELSPTIRTEVAIPLGALAATPAQSLARVRNQVREECANVCEEGEPTACDGYGIQLAIEIRATKEPE